MDDAEYEIVMPFVACRSQGGAYDDDAFVAGWRLAELDAELRAAGTPERTVTIRPADHAQADLIAMRHGYRLTTVESTDPSEWLTLCLRRTEQTGA